MSAAIRTSFSQQELEELVHRHAERGVAEQDFDIRIDRDGRWYHQGGLMQRPALVRMFASILTRLDDGSYWLVNPAERGRIEVEDAPFVATTMLAEGDGDGQRVRFTTNLGEEVELDADHPLRLAEGDMPGEPRPYLLVRGRLEARIARQAFYDLVDCACEEDGVMGVRSHGVFFPLTLAGDDQGRGA